MAAQKLTTKTTGKLQQILLGIERNQQKIVLILVTLVIFSGIIYSIKLGNTLRYHDERVYYTLAYNFANLGTYTLDGINTTASRPPVYPIILSFFVFLGADVMTLRIFNFVLFGASIFMLFKILHKSSFGISGLIAAGLIIFYPVLFYTAGTLYPQTLGSILLLCLIYLVFNEDTFSVKRGLFSGFLFGILMLCIPTFVFVLVITILFLIFFKADIKTPLTILLVSSMMIGTWATRNYLVFKTFVPFSTNMGINLLIGNSPHTTANSGVEVDLSSYRLHALNLTETERDAYFKAEAIKFITENKVTSIRLYLQKLFSHFNYQNKMATKDEKSSFKDLIMFITYYPLVALLLIRICFFRRYPISHFELYLLVIYVAGAFFLAIFFTRIRFRLPFDFLLIGIVASFLSKILNSIIRSKSTAVNSDYEEELIKTD